MPHDLDTKISELEADKVRLTPRFSITSAALALLVLTRCTWRI